MANVEASASKDDLMNARKKAESFPYPSLFDKEGEIMTSMGIRNLPASVLVDKRGEIMLVSPRALNQPQVTKILSLTGTL